MQPQVMQLTQRIEARKAVLISEMDGRIYARREENYFSI